MSELSAREVQVLALMAGSLTNGEIGRELYWDHDPHGPVIQVWPDGHTTLDDDCDCPLDCADCEADGIARAETAGSPQSGTPRAIGHSSVRTGEMSTTASFPGTPDHPQPGNTQNRSRS